MALALFLISRFIQNIWSKTTLPSLVSIQQAASEQSKLFFLGVHLLLCLSPEQRAAHGCKLQAQILHAASPKLDFAFCPLSVPAVWTGCLDRLSWFILQEIHCLKLLFRLRIKMLCFFFPPKWKYWNAESRNLQAGNCSTLGCNKTLVILQKMPFSLPSSLSEQCHSNGHSPAIWSLLVGLFTLDYCSEGREYRPGLHPAPSHFRIPARVAGEDAKSVLLSPLRTNLAGCRKQVLAALLTH